MKLGRRTWLKGAGGIAIALPFLQYERGKRTVLAAPDETPKRFVTWFTPNGHNGDAFPTNMNLAGTSLASLAPHSEDLIVIRGLGMASTRKGPITDSSHYDGWAHMLVADSSTTAGGEIAGGNISVDMAIANRIGRDTPYLYSLQSVDTGSAASWLGSGVAATPDSDPRSVFNRLFASLNVAPDELAAIRETRRSVLDYVQDSIRATQCQLGSTDRLRLDQHLSSIRDIESRLGASARITCSQPDQPPSRGSLTYPQIGQLHMQLLATAFACDLTRVGSVQWSRAVGGGTPTWLELSRSHHDISHDTSSVGFSDLRRIDAFYYEQLAAFLTMLKSIPEGDGTMLDHTVVLTCSEIGLHTGQHPCWDLGTLIAGGGGGTIAKGQFLDLRPPPNSHMDYGSNGLHQFDRDTPHNNLFVELINALSPSDAEPVTTFGNPTVCTGGLPQIRT